MSSTATPSIPGHRVLVGVADMGVSNDPANILSSYALGSCVAVVAYDPVAKVGGLLHLMLPDSKLSPEKAARQPTMFADTGLPLLADALTRLKGDITRAHWLVAGGASIFGASDTFNLGDRNIRAVTAQLARLGFPISQSALGGSINRNIHLSIASGEVNLKTPGGVTAFSLAA
jgi:chemotaxis protein CheD